MINPLSRAMPEPGIRNDLPTDLDGACRALEQQFTELLLTSMRKAFSQETAKKGSSGFSMDVSYSMMDTEMARISTQGDGMGLWRMMKEQLEPGAGAKSEKGSAEKSSGGIVRKMPYILG